MSSTQDLCDGVVTLEAAVRQYENAEGDGDRLQAWQQVRRAVGYMRMMAAWKEDMTVDEVLSQGHVAPDLEARWDMDRSDPFAR
jgi:hypothetical protein